MIPQTLYARFRRTLGESEYSREFAHRGHRLNHEVMGRDIELQQRRKASERYRGELLGGDGQTYPPFSGQGYSPHMGNDDVYHAIGVVVPVCTWLGLEWPLTGELVRLNAGVPDNMSALLERAEVQPEPVGTPVATVAFGSWNRHRGFDAVAEAVLTTDDQFGPHKKHNEANTANNRTNRKPGQAAA